MQGRPKDGCSLPGPAHAATGWVLLKPILLSGASVALCDPRADRISLELFSKGRGGEVTTTAAEAQFILFPISFFLLTLSLESLRVAADLATSILTPILSCYYYYSVHTHNLICSLKSQKSVMLSTQGWPPSVM